MKFKSILIGICLLVINTILFIYLCTNNTSLSAPLRCKIQATGLCPDGSPKPVSGICGQGGGTPTDPGTTPTIPSTPIISTIPTPEPTPTIPGPEPTPTTPGTTPITPGTTPTTPIISTIPTDPNQGIPGPIPTAPNQGIPGPTPGGCVETCPSETCSAGQTITFSTTEQITICAGSIPCGFKFTCEQGGGTPTVGIAPDEPRCPVGPAETAQRLKNACCTNGAYIVMKDGEQYICSKDGYHYNTDEKKAAAGVECMLEQKADTCCTGSTRVYLSESGTQFFCDGNGNHIQDSAAMYAAQQECMLHKKENVCCTNGGEVFVSSLNEDFVCKDGGHISSEQALADSGVKCAAKCPEPNNNICPLTDGACPDPTQTGTNQNGECVYEISRRTNESGVTGEFRSFVDNINNPEVNVQIERVNAEIEELRRTHPTPTYRCETDNESGEVRAYAPTGTYDNESGAPQYQVVENFKNTIAEQKVLCGKDTTGWERNIKMEFLMNQTNASRNNFYFDAKGNLVQVRAHGAERDTGELAGTGGTINNGANRICGNVQIPSPISLNWDNTENLKLSATQFSLDNQNNNKWYQWFASESKPLVVIDKEHTGKITSAEQLLGNYTFGKYWNNGYEALETLDKNKDGKVSGIELKDLALWFDKNQNGISETGEVKKLSDKDIQVTALYYTPSHTDISGNKNIHANLGFERILPDLSVPSRGTAKAEGLTGETEKVYGSSVDWFGKSSFDSKDEALMGKRFVVGLGFVE